MDTTRDRLDDPALDWVWEQLITGKSYRAIARAARDDQTGDAPNGADLDRCYRAAVSEAVSEAGIERDVLRAIRIAVAANALALAIESRRFDAVSKILDTLTRLDGTAWGDEEAIEHLHKRGYIVTNPAIEQLTLDLAPPIAQTGPTDRQG